MKKSLIAAGIFLSVFSPKLLHAEWRAVEPGFQYRQDSASHFFRIDPRRLRIGLLLASDYGAAAMTADRYRTRSGALLSINGGFFDESFRSLGLLVRKGRIVNPIRNVSWGIFSLSEKGPSIIHPKEWTPGASTAIQVGPRLVVDGKIPSFKEAAPSRRSGICITPDGQVEIGLAEGLISLRQWAEMMKKDCVQALNLDGGGSTQISVKAKNLNLELSGLTGVPNAIAIWR